jgi:GNAT superfamily N-acetyltransferase
MNASFDRVAPALARALCDDPFYVALLADAPTDVDVRDDLLTQYFLYSLQECAHGGRVVTCDAPGLGGAAWMLPLQDTVAITVKAEKAEFLKTLLGSPALARYQSIVTTMASQTGSIVPADAWYLSILGVHPRAQGHGLGGQLLAPTLAEARDAGARCYLETFSERNVAFYARLGFVVAGSFAEPITRSRWTVMLRDP